MLNCLHSNKTLKRLELAGNNVPGDILKAVGKYDVCTVMNHLTPFPIQHLGDIGHLLVQKRANPLSLPFSIAFPQCPMSPLLVLY